MADIKHTGKPNELNRRQFVRAAGSAAALAPLLASCSGGNGGGERVAVIGAGLGGLVAAWELKAAGIDVRLFEQSTRPGGRVWTLREQMDDGAWLDAGAMGGGQSYTHWTNYCEMFGQELTSSPTPATRPDTLMLLDREMYRGSALRSNPESWPLALNEDERSLAPFRLLSAHLRPVAEEIGAVANVLDPAYAHYDDMSLLAFLEQREVSAAAISLIERSLNYNSLATVSALSALRDTTRLLGASGPSVHVVGGNSGLPEAMASQLAGEIEYNRELISISQHDERVTLTFATPTGQEQFDAARVILALPFTALRNVDIAPTLPESRQRMIAELPYTQIAKTFVQTKSRFWANDTDFSILYSDSSYERVFNMSSQMGPTRGLLLNWINGDGIGAFAGMSPEQHSARVIDWMMSVWPDAAGQFEKAITVNWADTYAGGAYAHYAPGQLQSFAAEIPLPLGRLHFAGEHTELVAPGLEGAVVSGRRAAAEVTAAMV